MSIMPWHFCQGILILKQLLRMNKRDGILLGAAVMAALIWIMARSVTARSGAEVVISVDGREEAVYSLYEDRTETIRGAEGLDNVLEIRNGKARVKEAGCPDRLCVRQGTISKEGESIVCLPNRVVITVRRGEAGENDALAQ